VIPLITWLCTDLYRGRAEIYYQHEEMESVARIHFLQSGGVTESYAPLALED